MDEHLESSLDTVDLIQLMEQEGTEHRCVSELDAEAPVVPSPEPTESEVAFPVLRHDEDKNGSRKVEKTEIPDSDAFSPESSPVKMIKVNVGTHSSGTGSFPSISDPTMPEGGYHDSPSSAGDASLNEAYIQEGDLSDEVTGGTTESMEAGTRTGSGSVMLNGVENAIYAPIDTEQTSTAQTEGSKVEANLVEETSVMLGGEEAAEERLPSSGDKSMEGSLEATKLEDEASPKVATETYLNKAIKESEPPPRLDDAQGVEILEAKVDGEDTIMIDETLTHSEGLKVAVDSSSVGKDHDIERKTIEGSSSVVSLQGRSIPDSEDEESYDAQSIFEELENEKDKDVSASVETNVSEEAANPGPEVTIAPLAALSKTISEAGELLSENTLVAEASSASMEVTRNIIPSSSPGTHISSSPARRVILSSAAKIGISPNPSFKAPSPVKKNHTQFFSKTTPSSPSVSDSFVSPPPTRTGDKRPSSSTAGSGMSQNQSKDVVMAELKAMKISSIQARIISLQAEIATKRAKRDELQKNLLHPAAETVKRHIKLLHDYNDIKDIGQGLLGMIADQRGLRVGELYEEFGVDIKD